GCRLQRCRGTLDSVPRVSGAFDNAPVSTLLTGQLVFFAEPASRAGIVMAGAVGDSAEFGAGRFGFWPGALDRRHLFFRRHTNHWPEPGEAVSPSSSLSARHLHPRPGNYGR